MNEMTRPVEREIYVSLPQTDPPDRKIVLSAFEKEGSTDLILFLHGLACSKNSFRLAWQQPSLAPYRLLAIDLPGFGHTPVPADFDYTMHAYAELCAALIRQQPYQRLHLVVHSMAGAIALLLPESILNRLSSLTSVEGNLTADDCRLFSEKIMALSYAEFCDPFWPTLVASLQHLPLDAMDLANSSPPAVYHSACSLFRTSQGPEMLQRFLALGDKAHYVYGERHQHLPVLNQLPTRQTTAIADCGHFPMQENPREFYAAIARIVAIP